MTYKWHLSVIGDKDSPLLVMYKFSMGYEASPTIKVKPTGEEAVAVNLDSGEVFALNTTALRVFNLLIEGSTEAEAAQALAEGHGMDLSVAATRVATAVERLLTCGLILQKAD